MSHPLTRFISCRLAILALLCTGCGGSEPLGDDDDAVVEAEVVLTHALLTREARDSVTDAD